MLHKSVITLFIPALVVGMAARAADAPVEADPGPAPRIITVTPDLAGRMWFLALDGDEQLFVRVCANSQPADCGPWSQADIGWSERIRRAPPKGEASGPTVEGLLRRSLPELPQAVD